MHEFYEAFRLSGQWYLADGAAAQGVSVRGISLFAACQLYVFQLLVPQLAANTQSGVAVQHIKKQGWDWHIKMAASRFAPRKELSPSNTPRFVALYDTHNNAMVDSVAAVARELGSRGSTVIPVSSDPKIAKRGVGTCSPVGYSTYYGLRDEMECRRIWRSNKALILSVIDRLAARHSPPGSRSGFAGYLRRCLKQTIRDIIALDNLYKAIVPAAVFMGSDSHKLGRISALLGQQYAWRTLVLQHGAPMLPHAYIPVHADWIAVWGPSFREWFARHDVPAEKLIVTGAPRFDCYLPARQRDPGGRRKIVWLTTPAEDEVVRRCFHFIVSAVAATGLELVIKPHPSEPADTYHRMLAESEHEPASVVTGVQVMDVVKKGDLVFCLNSTAGIEAVALGGLLFVITMPSVPNSIPYEKFGVARVLTEASHLAAEVEQFIRYADSEHYLQEAKRFLDNYFGVLDGMSGRRVSDFLFRHVS